MDEQQGLEPLLVDCCGFLDRCGFGHRCSSFPIYWPLSLEIRGRLVFIRTIGCIFGAIGLTMCMFSTAGVAEAATLKDQLTGTWICVSSTGKREDGSSVQRPSLQGAITYTADGHFHFITTATDAAKYASNDPSRPSPDEAIATASKSIAYTGTYTVDESTSSINLSIETSTFPNLVGASNQRRIITSISADEMKFTNPRNPAGVTLEFVWKRAN